MERDIQKRFGNDRKGKDGEDQSQTTPIDPSCETGDKVSGSVLPQIARLRPAGSGYSAIDYRTPGVSPERPRCPL